MEHAGLVSLDWASFNLVLGALSNTFMKLLLVFSLGHRGLFKQLLLSFPGYRCRWTGNHVPLLRPELIWIKLLWTGNNQTST